MQETDERQNQRLLRHLQEQHKRKREEAEAAELRKFEAQRKLEEKLRNGAQLREEGQFSRQLEAQLKLEQQLRSSAMERQTNIQNNQTRKQDAFTRLDGLLKSKAYEREEELRTVEEKKLEAQRRLAFLLREEASVRNEIQTAEEIRRLVAQIKLEMQLQGEDGETIDALLQEVLSEETARRYSTSMQEKLQDILKQLQEYGRKRERIVPKFDS